jgi:hypothetical protein
MSKRENSWPYQDLNSNPSTAQPIASHYTNYAIPALYGRVKQFKLNCLCYFMMIHWLQQLWKEWTEILPTHLPLLCMLFPLHCLSLKSSLSLCFPACYWCDEEVSNVGCMGEVTYLNSYHSLTEFTFLIYCSWIIKFSFNMVHRLKTVLYDWNMLGF